MRKLILITVLFILSNSTYAKEKIKKSKGESFILNLSPAPDILSEMGKKKRKKQFLAGFALESNNELKNAVNKLEKKNLDMIVLNSLRDQGAGFKGDTNKIKILTSENMVEFPLKSKKEVAKDLLNYVEKQMSK